MLLKYDLERGDFYSHFNKRRHLTSLQWFHSLDYILRFISQSDGQSKYPQISNLS